MLDEPRLASARQLLMGPFRPAAVDELDALVERTCREVLHQHVKLDARILDVAAYSNDVLFHLMALLLGATPCTAPDLAVLFRRWMHRFNESPSLAALHRQPEIYQRLWRMIERHDGSPGLLRDVQAAWRRKETLGGDRPATRADYVALVWALIAAGTDTPATVATQGCGSPSATGRSPASRRGTRRTELSARGCATTPRSRGL
jgi:cytochrome P450